MVMKWTDEHKEFLKKNYPGRSRKELHVLFNNYFDLDLTLDQVVGAVKRLKLKNGSDGRFPKGHIPVNKGKKGMGGYPPTQFKKGHKPHNYLPVGTERVNGDGYIDIKIADPNKWKAKHRILWEEAHGPIPDDHVLIFADKDKLNCQLDNLMLVTRAQAAVLNNRGLRRENRELTETGLIIADLILKTGERARESKGGNKRGRKGNEAKR